eukprot:SAG31_NODE_933_length_10897_cov_15.489442_5_plen_194_part_00
MMLFCARFLTPCLSSMAIFRGGFSHSQPRNGGHLMYHLNRRAHLPKRRGQPRAQIRWLRQQQRMRVWHRRRNFARAHMADFRHTRSIAEPDPTDYMLVLHRAAHNFSLDCLVCHCLASRTLTNAFVDQVLHAVFREVRMKLKVDGKSRKESWSKWRHRAERRQWGELSAASVARCAHHHTMGARNCVHCGAPR